MQELRIHFRLNADNPEEAAIIDWLMKTAGDSGRLRIKKTIVPVLEQEARKHERRKPRSSRPRPAASRGAPDKMPTKLPDIEFDDLPPENDQEASEAPLQSLYFGSP